MKKLLLIGFVGLAIPSFEAHFTPCVEIGWRLSSKHWGKGQRPSKSGGQNQKM